MQLHAGKTTGDRPDAEAGHHEIGRQPLAIVQHHGADLAVALQRRRRPAETENDSPFAVQADEDVADAGAKLLLERSGFRTDDGHLQTALAQAGRDFHADEAGPEDNGPLTAFGLGEDGVGVGVGAEGEDVARRGARNVGRTGSPPVASSAAS